MSIQNDNLHDLRSGITRWVHTGLIGGQRGGSERRSVRAGTLYTRTQVWQPRNVYKN